MLRQLRIKFIVLNMAIAVGVIVVSFGAICVFYHGSETAEVDTALTEAIARVSESARTRNFGSLLDPGAGQGTPPQIGGERGDRNQIPTAAYVLLDNGSLVEVDTQNTATITDEVLLEAAAIVVGEPDGSGKIASLGLLYQRRTINSVRYVAFADIAEASGWESLALTLLGVGLLAIAVFFVISLFFSKWALAPVARAWEQQTRFVADASHDLKTPLTIILANSSIMRKHPEATVEEMSQWIESTESEAEGMQSLVSDLLLLAQLDEAAGSRGGAYGNGAAAAARASRQPLDFSMLVQGEVLQFESIAFERGIVLEDDIAAGIAITGDKAKLKRLTATLLDNACKYVDAHGRVDVSLRRSSDSRFALLAVHNTGPAIAEEDLPHVFDRFYRADKSRTADASAPVPVPAAGPSAAAATSAPSVSAAAVAAHPALSFAADSLCGNAAPVVADPSAAPDTMPAARGEAASAPSAALQPKKSHGLGLAIAQGIVQEHGGALTVVSTAGAGTTFTAKLPLG